MPTIGGLPCREWSIPSAPGCKSSTSRPSCACSRHPPRYWVRVVPHPRILESTMLKPLLAQRVGGVRGAHAQVAGHAARQCHRG
jgi:hypothetical protein